MNNLSKCYRILILSKNYVNHNAGQSVPIPRHSQTGAKSAHLMTLETKMNAHLKNYHTYKRINK